jgi:YgiT-type zinc finger domain-containing protein
MGSGFKDQKGATIMKCISCGAKTAPGTTTDVTDAERCLIIVRNVPCHKCSECDEVIYTGDVIKQLESITTAAKNAVNEIAIVDFDNKVA